MSNQFQETLDHIRTESQNSTELGSAFEDLVKVFLEHDPMQTQEYTKVWHYKAWAKGTSRV